jgi:hypothetical protein
MLGIVWSEHRLTFRRLLMSVTMNTTLMISNEGSAQRTLIPVSLALVVHLSLRISPRIFEIEMVLLRLSGALGKMIHEKHLNQKIS